MTKDVRVLSHPDKDDTQLRPRLAAIAAGRAMFGAVDEVELFGAWQAGDRVAGQTLIRAHYDVLYRFFCDKVDPEISADLTQATFESLCDRKEAYRGDASLRTYLFAIGRRKLIDHFRRVTAWGERFEPMEHSVPDRGLSQSMSTLLAGLEQETLVARALRTLPLDDQLILELKEYEDLTFKELALVYNVPQGTVASRTRRARARLATALDELTKLPRSPDSELGAMRTIRDRIRTSGG